VLLAETSRDIRAIKNGQNMRIFYASDTTPSALFDSNLWRNNLHLPLVDLGHDVLEFQYDLRETFQNLDRADPQQKAFMEGNVFLEGKSKYYGS
jgi:hypothetical protein